MRIISADLIKSKAKI